MTTKQSPQQPSTPRFATRNDLPAAVRERIVALLDARLADAIDLRTQLKVAHWNVKGPAFIALHELFDEIVEDADEYVDLIAERAVQLGGVARGTARQVAARSALPEYGAADAGSGDAHVDAVADALAAFGRAVREAIDAAAEAPDQGTADLFTGISRGTDKWLWMVEAHHAQADDAERARPAATARPAPERHASH